MAVEGLVAVESVPLARGDADGGAGGGRAGEPTGDADRLPGTAADHVPTTVAGPRRATGAASSSSVRCTRLPCTPVTTS